MTARRTAPTDGPRHVPAVGHGRTAVITYANWRHRCTGFVALWPEPFLEVDGTGTVIEWNPRAEEVFGWRRHEVVGRPVAETLLPAGARRPGLPRRRRRAHGPARPPGDRGRQRAPPAASS